MTRNLDLSLILTHTAQPDVKVSGIAAVLLRRIVVDTESGAAVLVLNPYWHSAEPDAVAEEFGQVCRQRFRQVLGKIPAGREGLRRQLARVNAIPSWAAFDREVGLITSFSEIDRLLDRFQFSWRPVGDVYGVLGWLGLSPPLSPSQFEREERLNELIAVGAISFGRLFWRDHSRRNGMDMCLVGLSPPTLELEARLKLVAASSRATVLLTGERGSGKELAAYAIHFFSERRDKSFLPVLASAFPESLQVAELFGHERHAFTGAAQLRKGKFLAANGGTIFLDEVADLPPTLQVTLLRVLEKGEIQPIGRDHPIRVDVRVVAATNQDLASLARRGSFRQDLYDRLSTIEIVIPPLRQREEDIALLARYFLLSSCLEIDRRSRIPAIPQCPCLILDGIYCAAESFFEVLKEYDWPGNVRELASLMARLSTISPNEILTGESLRKHYLRSADGGSRALRQSGSGITLEEATRRHIEDALKRSGYNQTRAARLLGVARTTLQSKMRKLGIRLPGRS